MIPNTPAAATSRPFDANSSPPGSEWMASMVVWHDAVPLAGSGRGAALFIDARRRIGHVVEIYGAENHAGHPCALVPLACQPGDVCVAPAHDDSGGDVLFTVAEVGDPVIVSCAAHRLARLAPLCYTRNGIR